jgi:hypothetical protein
MMPDKIIIDKMYCPNCKKPVEVREALYDPDDPMSMGVYECTECHEGIDFI